ncbi:MAG: CNT family concentrative nucleoside transporter [Myxococcota bacterium]|jgi:CNT family concentrative nucleoside transporter
MLTLLFAASALAAEGNFLPAETSVLDRALSLVGLGAMIGIAWLLSEHRKEIDWRPVMWGVGLQIVFGAVILSPTVSGVFYTVVDGAVNKLLSFANDGATFVFASIVPHAIIVGDASNAPQMVSGVSPPMMTFAFWVLPTIIFFSSLMSVLYHLGVMQVVVKAIAWVMVRTLGTSGAESLSAAGNIFVGQTEAPLLVKPFIKDMTRSELMAVMTGGFATVAGGVMGAYVSFLHTIPNIAGHLVMASILSAPAALACAKVMVPELGEPKTRGVVAISGEKPASNVLEAAAMGAKEGMELAINVAAMIIAIVGLVSMFDWFVGLAPVSFCSGIPTTAAACVTGEVEPLSLSIMLGWVFAPIAVLMGVPLGEALVVGRLLGEKIVLTEFVAYINLGALINGPEAVLSERSSIIASYALCGFANFASIGIQLGGIGGLAPNKMPELASLGLRAMTAGVLAACMTGCIAGIFL